jgi:hypothetical protein
MTKNISDSNDQASNKPQDASQPGNDPSQLHEPRTYWSQIEKDFAASLPSDLKPGQRRGINVSSPSILGAQHNSTEGQDVQSILDMGNSLANVSEMGAVIHASDNSANAMPNGVFKKATLLKDVNVRSSASSDVQPVRQCDQQGLFKVVHGTMGSDGLPEFVYLESLGDWDIENLPAGMVLTADLKQQAELEDGRWKSLHGAMQLQRDHHRNVSTGLRQQVETLSSLLRESVGMVRGVVGNCDDELGDRIDAALLEGASALKTSDVLALQMIGVKMPSMATEPVGEVKRYDFDRFGDKHQDEFGPYVLASDFDALAAQVISQGEVVPAEAILYQGEPGKLAVRLPHEPAPTGLGWNFHRKWELRRSAYSFETMTARLDSFAKLLGIADVIIRHWMNNETMRGFTLAASERFIEDYRLLNLPAEGV